MVLVQIAGIPARETVPGSGPMNATGGRIAMLALQMRLGRRAPWRRIGETRGRRS